MRLIRAQLKDVVNVHKLYLAYCEDTKLKVDSDAVFQQWIGELCNESRYYVLLMHGKKALGLIWGEETGEGFRVEGVFLKRAWRGKIRFSRWIYKALVEKKKKFGNLLISVPAECEGINTRKFILKRQIYAV